MKISIVTVTFNSASTIEDTIKSVLYQTHKDYEYIIVDGLSKDNTMDIIRMYQPLFEGRLKFISEKDCGIYDAMNKGLKMASGDYVGILNSDDFFTTNDSLACINKTLCENDLDAMYADVHFVKPETLEKCHRFFSACYFKPWMVRFGFMPPHATLYVKNAIFEKYGYYDLQYRTSSDFEMIVRLLYKQKIRTKYAHQDLVTMRLGGESTADYESKKRVQNDIAKSLKQYGIYSNILFQYVRYAVRICEIIYTKIAYRKTYNLYFRN